jgi:hypothetical protein
MVDVSDLTTIGELVKAFGIVAERKTKHFISKRINVSSQTTTNITS